MWWHTKVLQIRHIPNPPDSKREEYAKDYDVATIAVKALDTVKGEGTKEIEETVVNFIKKYSIVLPPDTTGEKKDE